MKSIISFALILSLLTSILAIDVTLAKPDANMAPLMNIYRKYSSDLCSIKGPISQVATDATALNLKIDVTDTPLESGEKIYLTVSYISLYQYQLGHCRLNEVTTPYDSETSDLTYSFLLDSNEQLALITVQFGIIKSNRVGDKYIDNVSSKHFLVSPYSLSKLNEIWSKNYANEPNDDFYQPEARIGGSIIEEEVTTKPTFKELINAGDYTSIGYLYLICTAPLLLAAIIRIIRHITIAAMTKKYAKRSILRSARSIGYEPQTLNLKIKSIPFIKKSSKHYEKVPERVSKPINYVKATAPISAAPKFNDASDRAE